MPRALAAAALLALCTGLAAAAQAGSTASLSLSTDRDVYGIGDTILVDVLGTAPPQQNVIQVFASLLFSDGGTRARVVSTSQEQITSFGGALPWSVGLLLHGPGFADVLNQIGGICVGPKGDGEDPVELAFASAAPAGIQPIDSPVRARVVLEALAPGRVSVAFDTTTPTRRLDFLGIAAPPPLSFTIVPEPGTAPLLALGLAALSRRRRGRRQ